MDGEARPWFADGGEATEGFLDTGLSKGSRTASTAATGRRALLCGSKRGHTIRNYRATTAAARSR